MKKKIKKIIKVIVWIIIVVWIIVLLLSIRTIPKKIDYGVSFNTLYARELGLDWKVVYNAIIDELGVKKIRLAAHWDMIEPEDDQFNFKELDYQIDKASLSGAEIILAVGKRLPRWPECHVPNWAFYLKQEGAEQEILEYIEQIVKRYRDNESIKIWQVENEPFFSMFAREHCNGFTEEFLEKEIQLVKNLDPQERKVLVTDSGELSTWARSYRHGDIFGSTLYLYAWNKYTGDTRNWIWPGLYAMKRNIWNFFYGKKEAIVAELSLEPWLDRPVVEEKIEVQMKRMSPKRFDKILKFASKTGFRTQYLWGAEWWYYMNLQGEPWYWERGKEIFK
jgi:hypothetical protein